MSALSPTKRGFTIIEILVVIGIISLVFVVGVTQYREYSRRQALENVVKDTVSKIREVQNRANAGYKPNSANCDDEVLNGIQYSISGGSYTIYAKCDSNLVIIQNPTNFPAGYTFTASPTSVTFLPVGKGTDLAGNMTITITDNDSGSYGSIVVSQTGKIDYGIII